MIGSRNAKAAGSGVKLKTPAVAVVSLFLRLCYPIQGTEFAVFCCDLEHPSPFLLTIYSQLTSNEDIMNRSHF
jgi:hypothetical protein